MMNDMIRVMQDNEENYNDEEDHGYILVPRNNGSSNNHSEHSSSLHATKTDIIMNNIATSGRKHVHPNEMDNDTIYFNHAQQAILTSEVQQAGIDHIISLSDDINEDIPHDIRVLFSKLIHATENTIAIIPCTAFAITLAAYNIERQCLLSLQQQQQRREERGAVLQESIKTATGTTIEGSDIGPTMTTNDWSSSSGSGYSIVVLQDEMESAVYGWEEICQRHPTLFHLDIIPYPKQPNETWTELLINHMHRKMKKIPNHHRHNTTNDHRDDENNDYLIAAVCITPLHWSDGTSIDLLPISELCHEYNIPFIIDATQAIGIVPHLDVTILRPTMVCCSIHKWLRGPSGSSLVYIDPKLYTDWRSLDQHGRNRLCSIHNPYYHCYRNHMQPPRDGYPYEYIPNDARKFDSGGKPNAIILSMLRMSLRQVSELGDFQLIQHYLQTITTPLIQFINTHPEHFVPIDVLHRNYYHIIGIQPQRLSTDELITICLQLKEKYHISTAVRCGVLRISSYITNTSHDVQQLIKALQELFGIL